MCLTVTHSSHAETDLFDPIHYSHAETDIVDNDTLKLGPCGSDFFDVGRDRVWECQKMSGSGSGLGSGSGVQKVSGSSRDQDKITF